MRLTVTLAVVLPMMLASRAEAQSYKCLNRDSCAPPPCEFFAQLDYLKAEVRTLARMHSPQVAPTARTREAYAKSANKQTAGALKKYLKCAPEIMEPELDVSCAISPPLADSLKASPACSEIVEAQYAGARLNQALCQANANQQTPMTFAQVRAELMVIKQANVNSLEAALAGFLPSCAPTIAGELSAAGVSALTGAGRNARAGAKARRAAVGPPAQGSRK
jgi:hypothetical protein